MCHLAIANFSSNGSINWLTLYKELEVAQSSLPFNNHFMCIYSYLVAALEYLCGVFVYDGINGQIISLSAFFFTWLAVQLQYFKKFLWLLLQCFCSFHLLA